ncbi:hypothetical protein [Sinosporangium siamense]|uniref:Uncharacterized protein n=1 Tax=Sinosporangium siamense TaxID=1367973 RepID=A0A919V6E6_9ACTN|nr:hypothetical protein [Sinosporangium siamense]GII93975.1 hypothetical protein Ssi02_42060 [Sinosporangium siamense]
MKLVRISPTPLPGGGVAAVREALLPMLHWRNVPVLRRQSRELTSLERFVLEMGLTFGTVEPADFAAVTSLPPAVLAGAAWRLVADGVLACDGSGYRVDPERAATVLRQRTADRPVPSTADFVLLPRTGELFVVPSEQNSWLRDLERKQVIADLRAPVPSELRAYTRAEYLGMRVREGTAGGRGSDIADVPIPEHGDVPLIEPLRGERGRPDLPGVCPVYRCRAIVREEPGSGLAADVTVTGTARRSGKNGERAEVSFTLAGSFALVRVDGLLGGWLEIAGRLEDPALQRALGEELGLPGAPALRRRGYAAWEVLVNGEAARALCRKGRTLSDVTGFAVQAEEAAVEVSCRFFPVDDEARLLFARDDVVAAVMAAPDPAKALRQAAAEAGRRYGAALTEESIRERIWALGHYALTYELRRGRDFAYD